MSDQFYKKLLQNFERKKTSELRKILAEADSGEWSDDAVKAAEVILASRPEELDANEPLVVAIDRRGQTAFALSPEEIDEYRSKIQILGRVFYIIGGIAALVLFCPLIFGKFNAFTVGSGVLGIILGLFFVFTGSGLIKLRAESRISGLVLSAILLTFFPIGTIIGFLGLLWLGKRGSVMRESQL